MGEIFIVKKIILLIMCHLLGDYVLQNDFIAKTKGSNWYHLFVHSALYCLPFMIFSVGFDLIDILLLFLAHMVIDLLKARYNMITYTQDQILHYMVIATLAI